MLVKFDLLYPKHVLLKFKKSINRITIFWIFSPFGLVKRLFADLFFIKRGYFLSFFYKETVINRKRKSAILSQLTLLKNDFVGISKSFRLMVWVKGVGFKMKAIPSSDSKSSTLLKLNLGRSYTLSIRLPKSCKVFLIGKKKMLFKGITMQELSQFVFFLQSFKFPNSYVERGLIFKYEIQVLKPGKKI